MNQEKTFQESNDLVVKVAGFASSPLYCAGEDNEDHVVMGNWCPNRAERSFRRAPGPQSHPPAHRNLQDKVFLSNQ